MATPGPLKLVSEGEYVITDGRTCFVDSISKTLGFNQYNLIDIDSGVMLKRARYQIEPTAAMDVFVKPDEPFEIPDFDSVKEENTDNAQKKRFVEVSMEDLDKIELNRTSKRTRQQTVWAVSVFKGKPLSSV